MAQALANTETFASNAPSTGSAPEAEGMAEALSTCAESGHTLGQMTAAGPVLLVFLRHFGCTFARQAIEDVSKVHARIEASGVQPAFVHLGTPELARPYFEYYGVGTLERFADPEAHLYQNTAFAIPRGSLWQMLGPAVWWGWIAKDGIRRYGISGLQNSPKIMPGVFLIRDGKVARRYIHKNITDRPDYVALAA